MKWWRNGGGSGSGVDGGSGGGGGSGGARQVDTGLRPSRRVQSGLSSIQVPRTADRIGIMCSKHHVIDTFDIKKERITVGARETCKRCASTMAGCTRARRLVVATAAVAFIQAPSLNTLPRLFHASLHVSVAV